MKDLEMAEQALDEIESLTDDSVDRWVKDCITLRGWKFTLRNCLELCKKIRNLGGREMYIWNGYADYLDVYFWRPESKREKTRRLKELERKEKADIKQQKLALKAEKRLFKQLKEKFKGK